MTSESVSNSSLLSNHHSAEAEIKTIKEESSSDISELTIEPFPKHMKNSKREGS